MTVVIAVVVVAAAAVQTINNFNQKNILIIAFFAFLFGLNYIKQKI